MGIAFFTHFTEICYDGIAYLNHQHSFSMLWDKWHVHNDTPATADRNGRLQTDFKWEKEHRYETSDQRPMEWLRHVYPT